MTRAVSQGRESDVKAAAEAINLALAEEHDTRATPE